MAEEKTELQVVDKNTLRDLLDSPTLQKAIEDILPNTISKDQLITIAQVAASRNQLLFKCSQMSFIHAVIDSARLGLLCDGTLGQGYLVPFWNGKIKTFEVKFIAGYRGYQTLAWNSGKIKNIISELVYQDEHNKEDFHIELGDVMRVHHIPKLEIERKPDNVMLGYCVAFATDFPKPFIEYMTKKQLDGIRERTKSRSKEGKIIGPWRDDCEEMYRKTLVRRAAKRWPLSPEDKLAKLQDYENKVDETFRNVQIADIPDTPTPQEIESSDTAEARVDKSKEKPAEEISQNEKHAIDNEQEPESKGTVLF